MRRRKLNGYGEISSGPNLVDNEAKVNSKSKATKILPSTISLDNDEMGFMHMQEQGRSSSPKN